MKRGIKSGYAWVFAYIAGAVAMLVYSYTQVDLGLTVASGHIFHSMQVFFQNIGYFNRQLSTVLYLALIVWFFGLYVIVLKNAHSGKLSTRQLATIIGICAGILVFAYPAFSHDIFNYMFTAKTVLVYGKNPYGVIPLQFAQVDPWLGFMRWTHLPSAYTPLWIGITLPFFVLGFRLFLPTLWSFKAIGALSYIACAYVLYLIMKRAKPTKAVYTTALFALNPLVILESLVSAHNDIVMMACVLYALYILEGNKTYTSLFALSVSVGIKLMTVFLLPLYIVGWTKKRAFVMMSLAFVSVLFIREVLPWYFLWVLPFAALIPEYTAITVLMTGISAGLVLRYTPYLYFGHYNDPVASWKFWFTVIPIAVSLGILLIHRFVQRRGSTVK